MLENKKEYGAKSYQLWSSLQINKAIAYKSEGYSYEEITIKINTEFNLNRTRASVKRKIISMTTGYNKTKSDLIIIKHIKENPLNLRYAFKLASIEIKKMTAKQVEGRYYYYLKTNHNMITVGSKVGFSNNVKNLHTDINGNLPKADMNNIQWLMKQILELSKEDREKLLNFF